MYIEKISKLCFDTRRKWSSQHEMDTFLIISSLLPSFHDLQLVVLATLSHQEPYDIRSFSQKLLAVARTTFDAGQLALASELCYYLLLDFDFQVCLFFV